MFVINVCAKLSKYKIGILLFLVGISFDVGSLKLSAESVSVLKYCRNYSYFLFSVSSSKVILVYGWTAHDFAREINLICLHLDHGEISSL